MASQNIILMALALVLVLSDALSVRGGQTYAGEEYSDELIDLLDNEELRKVESGESLANEVSGRGPQKSRKFICFTARDVESANQVDKRFMRFGKRESLRKQSDYTYEDDAQSTIGGSPDKRFLRFGKRFMRFGKRSPSTTESKKYCVWL
uniref:FMRFamide neuropeptide n=1 Tax=Hirudo medicinalis TaxID=6421 RepID=Q6DTZ5_HIRME|nr:FMRFamide neuropeptide precursor [Hirudo medicinalis]